MDGNAKVEIRNFNCLKCGSPLVVRGMRNTLSVVCGSCGAVIDISDENFKILDAYNEAVSKLQRAVLIPLGTRGVLRGEKWEVIGFMRRSITVEGVSYGWSEYLLFNPFKGFRWLTDYNGHWNYVRQCVDRPSRTLSRELMYRGRKFKHFQTALATVDYALGEFYWRVMKDDSAHISDFVAPPYMMSSESTSGEVTWSEGEYISSREIEKAFQLKSRLPAPVGVYANQPSPYAGSMGRVWSAVVFFVGLALLVQLLSMALAQNKLVQEQSLNYNPGDVEKSRVTQLFDLTGRQSNVVIRSTADVNNSWIYLNYALINDETGTAYDVGREIGYYTGRDDDGPWTEGNRSDEVSIPRVPSGRYYLRIEPEGDSRVAYRVAIYRDVPGWTHFLIAVILLLIAPVMVFGLHMSFENRRWAESDHPWSS